MSATRFLFTGREFVKELGVYDYRNRLYSASLGKFLQRDPILFDGGDVNLYRYVGNNGVNFRDKFGLKKCNNCNLPSCENCESKLTQCYQRAENQFNTAIQISNRIRKRAETIADSMYRKCLSKCGNEGSYTQLLCEIGCTTIKGVGYAAAYSIGHAAKSLARSARSSRRTECDEIYSKCKTRRINDIVACKCKFKK